MTRFNYLSVPAVPFTSFGKHIVDERLRPPLVCLAGTIVLIAGIYGVQSFRLGDAASRYEAFVQKQSVSDVAVHDVKILDAHVRDMQRVVTQVDAIQRSGVVHANELAWIGNHLPNDTWLAALHHDGMSYSLEGGTDRVAAVGSAMTALRDNPDLGTPRLIAVSEDPSKKSGLIRYTLRLEPAAP
jgi:Tfp pilus assembly protein PilN